MKFIGVTFSFLGLFYIIVYLCMCVFVVLDLASSVLCQEIGWEQQEERLRKDLFCVPCAGSGAVSKWVICACDSLVDFGAV